MTGPSLLENQMHRLSFVALAAITLSAAAPPVPKIAQDRFSVILRDPASTQYKIDKRLPTKVCGHYNSKNAYGGYAGFEPFVFLNQSATLYTVGMEITANGVIDSRNLVTPGMSNEELMVVQEAGNQLFARIRSAFAGCN
jgi:hypothetical protein